MPNNKLNYIAKYNKANYKMYQFRIRKDDTKVIEFLDGLNNRNEYIKNLIDRDINNDILTIKQIKQRIKPVLVKYGIKEVYLFGSYARGEASKNSDVDIYCEKGNVQGFFGKMSVVNFEEDLKAALQKDVDVVFTTSSMDEFFHMQLAEDLIKLC